MNLDEWFQRGYSAQEYVDSMDEHQDDFIHIYEQFNVDSGDYPLFQSFQKRDLRAVIITEDWCGDAMLNIPIFLNLAEASHIQTRFLFRDENPELMDQYLTNEHSRSIPKIIIISSKGEEITHWGPRAPELQQFIDESLEVLPDKKNKDYYEKQNEMLKFIIKSFRDHKKFWDFVYEDMKKTLQ